MTNVCRFSFLTYVKIMYHETPFIFHMPNKKKAALDIHEEYIKLNTNS